MMCRVNLFGKGALPLQSCNTTVRNIHDSYFGTVEPIHSPSGRNIGISLHFTPEVSSHDLHVESNKLMTDNIFMKLYKLQDEVDDTTVTTSKADDIEEGGDPYGKKAVQGDTVRCTL